MKKLLLILLLVVNVKASECNYNTKVGRFLQESLQNVHDNLGSEEKYQLACRGANEWHKTLIRLKPKRYYSQIDLNEQVRALNVIYMHDIINLVHSPTNTLSSPWEYSSFLI